MERALPSRRGNPWATISWRAIHCPSKGKSDAPVSVDSDNDFTPRSKTRSYGFSKGKSAAPASINSND
jgi:hypothetical protein